MNRCPGTAGPAPALLPFSDRGEKRCPVRKKGEPGGPLWRTQTDFPDGGRKDRLLDDEVTYLGNQLECEFGGDRCFGIAANMDFILVCTYEENGENPELIVYKKR